MLERQTGVLQEVGVMASVAQLVGGTGTLRELHVPQASDRLAQLGAIFNHRHPCDRRQGNTQGINAWSPHEHHVHPRLPGPRR